MTGSIEVSYKNEFSAHGEQVVHSLDGMSVPREAFTWPEARFCGAMVATVDGIVAGRACFGGETYPLAELENLYVAPAFRGRGVASALVGEQLKQAARLGYLAAHLQTDPDNFAAHRLYTSHGFLPAQRGESLRMIRFLNYPALAHFLARHPLALFDSRPTDTSEGLWELVWTDAISSDTLAITLSGRSCQNEGGGFGPGVARFEMRSGETSIAASISGPAEVCVGNEFAIEASVAGSVETSGACRLLLNPGFAPADGPGSVEFRLDEDSGQKLRLPVTIGSSFDSDGWKYRSYPSVPVGVEFFVGDCVFWLATQVKVASAPGP